jgi:hypothetical protein
MMEQRLTGIQEAISRTAEGKDAALILIKQAVPCIMHLENRSREKIITVVIYIGAARYLFERNIASLAEYAERIQRIVQTHILGTRLRPKQWRFPLKDDGKEVTIKCYPPNYPPFFHFLLNIHASYFFLLNRWVK